LVLGKYLRKTQNVEISYITKKSQAAERAIAESGFDLYVLDFNISSSKELDELNKLIYLEAPDSIFIDVLEHSSSADYISYIKKMSDSFIVSFTDVHEKMDHLPADVVVNSSIHQIGNERLYNENYYVGLDYSLLAADYMSPVKQRTHSSGTKKIMVCMGGVDHNYLTHRVLLAVDNSLNNFEFIVVLNSLYTDIKKMELFQKSMKHKMSIIYDVDGIYETLNAVDIAITAGGNAHSERICAGVPGIVISQESHQDASVKIYEKLGATLNLGLYTELSEYELLKEFDELYENATLQKNMVKIGRKMLDGRGLERIANIVIH
jgi:spore coat polysaccharide biosynthesis predicted glycosyltransferase SpsG